MSSYLAQENRLDRASVQRSKSRIPAGFTLIELVIVVAVVALLATIAVPSYVEYVRRSNRASAKATMAEVVAKQESWRADRKVFATSLAALGYPATTYLLRDGSPSSSTTSAVYRLEMTTSAGPPVSFASIQAVPIAGQTQDKCGTLIINATGARDVSGAASGWDATRCWKN